MMSHSLGGRGGGSDGIAKPKGRRGRGERGGAAGGAALYQPQGYFLAGKALFSHGTRMQASIAVITISGSM